MANIRARNGKLLFDFTYQGVRCREQTTLLDNRLNRSRLMGMLNTMEAEIRLNRFVFRNYFPSSPRCSHFVDSDVLIENNLVEVQKYSGSTLLSNIPTFSLFTAEWLAENRIQWKISHYKNVAMIFERYLMPEFGHFRLDEITRPQLIKYRASISEPKRKGRQGKLSNDWINHVMTPLRGILNEAALRFEFPTPFTNIRPLKIDKTPIEPFSLADVQLFLSNVREDFRDYYTVRFFTAMRTAEIDGLKWQYVNLERGEILVQETLVDGNVETPKTSASYRSIQLSQPVTEALKRQFGQTGRLTYVFCNSQGKPLDHRNVTKRIWYPALTALNLKRRRPYQTRHTCATLWLAAGESPEWIAKQMGHSTTKMLFEVYSRYVPNITRQDGSAFDRLVKQIQLATSGDPHYE
ncbi:MULTISPECIES: tyrosine-type recombinase/integrase [Shewanella]|uniref:tyrosine-type recombinase/integrase n=1 Tax=Shewanella TaxID=22 RepID=UPI001CF45B50|nr:MULTISPECIES: tyrosine-type recombinase/integrase [Shewanella]MCB2381402.1 site-specific integrase [Shewanella sp. SR1]MCS6098794.1 site-specific integrase [Shewanella baltica]MCS6182250.1 site-specific integrase [Shewanella baltica]